MKQLRGMLSAIQADISSLDIEAIVNAANEPLIMGGGVDGAIRRKAGPEMESELRAIGHCPTGHAIITGGHRLPARHVIHTVAPIFSESSVNHTKLLADCYRNSLALAQAQGIREIAFPCLGTGVYGWPPELAARTAFDAVVESFHESDDFTRVIFCCFSLTERERYETLIAAATS